LAQEEEAKICLEAGGCDTPKDTGSTARGRWLDQNNRFADFGESVNFDEGDPVAFEWNTVSDTSD
jgi:hypothetical protein